MSDTGSLSASLFSGSASALVDNDINTSTGWKTSYTTVDLGAGNAIALSHLRAYVVSQQQVNFPSSLYLYSSNSGTFTGEEVEVCNLYLGINNNPANTWLTSSTITNATAFR